MYESEIFAEFVGPRHERQKSDFAEMIWNPTSSCDWMHTCSRTVLWSSDFFPFYKSPLIVFYVICKENNSNAKLWLFENRYHLLFLCAKHSSLHISNPLNPPIQLSEIDIIFIPWFKMRELRCNFSKSHN